MDEPEIADAQSVKSNVFFDGQGTDNDKDEYDVFECIVTIENKLSKKMHVRKLYLFPWVGTQILKALIPAGSQHTKVSF